MSQVNTKRLDFWNKEIDFLIRLLHQSLEAAQPIDRKELKQLLIQLEAFQNNQLEPFLTDVIQESTSTEESFAELIQLEQRYLELKDRVFESVKRYFIIKIW